MPIMDKLVNPRAYNKNIIAGWWIRYIFNEFFPKKDNPLENKLLENSGMLNILFELGYNILPRDIPIRTTPYHGSIGK